MKQMQFITVLKSGGIYGQEHVEQLYDEFLEYAPDGVDFTCLSDIPGVPGYYPLLKNYPGWWSKIEIFDQFPGPWLYVDLDTVILGDISNILAAAEKNWFTLLRDFNPSQRLLGTGVMGHGSSGRDLSFLAEKFAANPPHWQNYCQNPRWWGDQGFVEKTLVTMGIENEISFFQNMVPGEIVSYKKQYMHKKTGQERIVCFHGKPRPWETSIRGK